MVPALPALDLLTAAVPGDPVLDTALSRALLVEVAAGERPDVFRLARPGPMVSFGRLDALAPGFPEAVDAAREHGFAAVHRVGGGRAAVFHEETLLIGHARAEPARARPRSGLGEPRIRTRERFEAMAELLAGALRRVGVDAQIGELPGEYCPGTYSLHAGGVKIAGIAQRVVQRASWTEGVVVVGGGNRVRDVLIPVYEALEQRWDPATAGDAAGPTVAEALAAVRAELSASHELRDVELDQATLERARAWRGRHDPPSRVCQAKPARGRARRNEPQPRG